MAKKAPTIKFSSKISNSKIEEILAANSQDAEEFSKEKGKIRISTMLDADILHELKKRAGREGDGRYQTYLNQLLRTTLFGPKERVDEEQIAKVVKDLVKSNALKQKRA